MTEFEQRVYECVKRIPKGKVMTYKQVAKKIKSPKAVQAVGNALNKAPKINPYIPCHRVVKSNGEVGKYRHGKEEKIKTLKREGLEINDGKVDLDKFSVTF